MTDAELDEIEKRAMKATYGPWVFRPQNETEGCAVCVGPAGAICAKVPGRQLGRIIRDDTARFICAARTDVPALVAEVRRLREEVTELRVENQVLSDELANENNGRHSESEEAQRLRATLARIVEESPRRTVRCLVTIAKEALDG